MKIEFIDLASKAKELGITELVLRTRILSRNDGPCFAFIAGLDACGTQETFLPAWTDEEFPFIEWDDYGSWIDGGNLGYTDRRSNPRYKLHGWAAIPRATVATILTIGEARLDGMWVWACDAKTEGVCPVLLNVKPREEWVDSRDSESGGYYREIPVMLTRADLCMQAANSESQKPLTLRQENSYLGIIAAMRGLLLAPDGGGFPNQSRIIDLLVQRYGRTDGVSKRNLEKVFPEAVPTLVADPDLEIGNATKRRN